jgi:hypothetical protein
MKTKSPSLTLGRRQFLKNMLPAGTLFCVGCSHLSGMLSTKKEPKTAPRKDIFLQDSGMSWQEVFAFTFHYYYIPVMQKMADELGRETFLEKLKKASAVAAAENIKKMAESFPKKRDLAMMSFFNRTNVLFQHALDYEVIEDTDRALELRVHRCLWAKTFCEVNAADIGFAAICFPDYAMATAFNPKIRMIRSKTLMQGNDCCNHRYVMED